MLPFNSAMKQLYTKTTFKTKFYVIPLEITKPIRTASYKLVYA